MKGREGNGKRKRKEKEHGKRDRVKEERGEKRTVN